MQDNVAGNQIRKHRSYVQISLPGYTGLKATEGAMEPKMQDFWRLLPQ